MGDRLLAIWQGQGYYHYTTCNAVNGNANVIQNIDYPADIEGVWTYIYYSYSEAKSRAVGFIKYGAEDTIKAIRHDVTHPDTKYVRFTLGGTDAKRYPGFNGIFTQVTFDAAKGVFIDTADQLKGYLNKLENPTVGQVDLQTYRLVTNEQFREKTNDPNFNAIGKDNERFPLEYSISGWFKWQQAPQDAWQNIFRVSLNEKPSDQFLGDRTLSAWIGTGEGGIIHLPTYTYANMNGGGNANVWKNIQHKDRHTKWFFIYFGYSKTQAKAYSYIKWQTDDDFLNYDNTNHYYAPNFQVFLGRDKFFTGWNGKIAYAQFNLGKGAYRSAKDFTHPNDAFGIGAGVDKLKKPDTGFKPAESDPAVKENAFNQDKPIHDKSATSENPFDEYGYGFWMRFLTAYPQRLNNGKNEAWYFVSRLANQEKYDNIRMGDRMLAIWQGQGYYHFTAANVLTGNPNMIQNVNYPEDIEGLWTYVYYSYSVEENKAQGFIKFGEENFKQITHQTTQPLTKYLRFIIGGNDDKRYPGFNGLFTSITFSTQIGAYVDSLDSLNKYVNANPYPKLDTTPQNYLLIKDPINRKPEDDFFLREFKEEKQRFPVEYSISGWYKWIEGTPANQWQNLYRVLLKKEPTDTAILGDRTLAGWIGFGNVHQSTYSYVNMNGAGNNNIWKQAEHKDRHLRWFFVYHGYSRNDRLSYAYVQYYKGAESLSWDKVNHYFVPVFYVYVGRDAINGFNGQIGAINFNLGAGSFRKGEDFTHDKDFFGFGAPFVQTKVKPFDVKDRTTDLLVSAAPSQEKPSYTKVLPEDEVASAEEYGYGFWARYLTQYPTPQRAGMQGEWTFVSRLTKNQKLQDVTLGDRTLAIFLNRNSAFYFATTNAGNPNAFVNSAVRPDFEGVWIYVHFSHNLEKKSSVAFLKYGDEKPFRYQQVANHVPPSFLQFYLGGKDFYNSWNGQFSDVMVSASKGIFIDDEAALIKHLSGFKMPAQFNYDLKTIEVIPKEQLYDAKQEIKEQLYQEDVALRPEYAWSGWFKWDNSPVGNWFLYARLSIFEKPENLQALGDRTLAAWAGPGNVLQFSTYNYNNLVGGGNADSWNRLNFGQELVRWHYVYFGYSLIERAAYYRTEFKGRLEEFTFKDHKHYYPNRFSLQIGKDKFSQPFVGLAAYFRLNVGEGAYRTSGYEKAKNDIFAYNLGKQTYVKPSPTFDINKDQNKGVSDSPTDGKDPVWTKKLIGSDLDDINEYGYSFWLRHMAHYPVQMPRGLADKAWSFVARLTKNQQLQDITVGDRVLAVWLQQGNYYHFTTYHQANPNLVQNINNPNDIDGVWYYLHFAHNLGSKQSVGFLHNGEKLNKVVLQQDVTFLDFSLYLYQNQYLFSTTTNQLAGEIIFLTKILQSFVI